MDRSEMKKKAFSGVFWKLMERFLAQGISLIVSIVLARILSPTEFSVVGIVAIFFNFANVFITSGLNTALVQKKDADKLDYSTVLLTSLVFSAAVYLVLFIAAPSVARIFNQPVLQPMIRLMALTLPITAIKAVWCAYISSHLLFRRFFFATLGGTLFSGVVGIAMALRGCGAWALIAQQMTNTAIDTVILVCCTRVELAKSFSFDRLRGLFRYAWKLFLSSLLGTTYTEISPLVIGLRFSPENLSFYTKGKSFPSMLSTTATSTLSAVLFPVLAKVQDQKEQIREYTRLYMRLSSFLCFPVMLGFFAVADNFTHVVLTDKWMPAVYYMRVFCLCYMFDVVAIGNCETIKAIGRSDVYLLIEVIKKAGYFLTLIVFLIFAPSPEVLALAYVICTVIQVAVNSVPNIRLIGYRYRDQLWDLLPNLLLAAVACGLAILVGKRLAFGLLPLCLQIITGVVTYIGLAALTRNPSLFYLMRTGREFMDRRKTP